MPFELKEYQRRCLDELAAYLRRTVQLDNAGTAFYEATERPYAHVKALPGLPYVCLRVPTGGGKTVMAAYAVGIAAKEFLRIDRCLVLWLAPTTQIVEQTLKALRDKRDPYRQALDDAFEGCVSVLDLSGALSVQRSALDADTVVIVSTLAAMRVENTEGRKIYEANGQLMDDFSGLTEEQKAPLLDGGVPSLANLLRLRCPLVIVDEAHNARTSLSFETLARFNPSCILEFTATPDEDPKGDPSNILTHVSAAELKEAEMIKLPIRLKTRANWREAVKGALDQQALLERLAREEEAGGSEYIRPIVLFQAQPDVLGEGNITFSILKQALISEFSIPEEQIAVSTGKQNDLEGVQVLEPTNLVRYIITVSRLREGWDCPFAYILCSVSNLTSKTAVEQVLGRIMRMPYARRRGHDELNLAYAYVTSTAFKETADNLVDALVESGFERFEAARLIRPDPTLPFAAGGLFGGTISEVLTEAPALERLPEDLRTAVSVRTVDEEVFLTYSGPPMTIAHRDALKATVQSKSDHFAVELLFRKSRGEDAWPAAMGQTMSVPCLALRTDQGHELLEDQFKEVPWDLAKCDASLEKQEFSGEPESERVAIVDARKDGKIVYGFIEELHRQLSFIDLRGPKSEAELANWLDREIAHPDITQVQASLFLRRMIRYLIENRGIPLTRLVVDRYRLREVASAKIQGFRSASVQAEFQRVFLPDAVSPVEVGPDLCFTFPVNQYPAPRVYTGPFRFRKHFYEIPAEMNGEEVECAVILDTMRDVKFWVRNLTRDQYAFWLPTSTDKFYPDFVALLRDGRYLVVEYKMGKDMDTSDTREKRDIGDLWQARSAGRCLFRLVTREAMRGILEAAVRS